MEKEIQKQLDELASLMSEKQKAFCDYYIETQNATEAARRAGYSAKTARGTGCENLTKQNIKAYIELRLKLLEDERTADAKEVLEYLTAVMRGEVKDAFDLDPSLADRTKAAELLGKRYRLFVDKQEVEMKGEPVQIINDIPRSMDG